MRHWQRIHVKSTCVIWEHLHGDKIIVVKKPEGYDYWNIFDSSGEVSDGFSLGPFSTLDDAIDRINEDIPDIEL